MTLFYSSIVGQNWLAPLVGGVLIVVTIITLPVLLSIIQINYRTTERVVHEHAVMIVERFRAETTGAIISEFDELDAQVATAAEVGRQEAGFFADNRSLGYFFRILQNSQTALNAYIGLEADGAFRQARRLHNLNLPVFDTLPPPGSHFAYRLVEPDQGPPVLDQYVFLDADQQILGQAAGLSTYDPRQRPWYEQAARDGGLITTDPEVFWAFGLVGFTVAEPIIIEDELFGVIAIDVTLDSFSQYLSRNLLSRNSLTFLLDARGNVLAASDRLITYGSDNDAVRLSHITDIGNALVANAYLERPGNGSDDVYAVRYDGQEYIVGISDFSSASGKPWRMMVLTPLSDFSGELTRNNRLMATVGMIAVGVQLIIIYVVAARVAAPLAKLSRQVERIRKLEPADTSKPIRSRVREIASLSRAVETLDTAVQTFAQFVPVGLVRQLLGSEQKLDIGGQSKFLTIFFSDMEGFSALAERIASRDLLQRVSIMLEVVTRSVHVERGTIDKFMGDGVMAFWGAPAPLDDHAWHACVAALCVQRDMEAHNKVWRAEDAPEMRLRIGIHSDAVLVGNVGSHERMSYTVLGDGVNIAARLEALNKEYGTFVSISHDTFQEAGDRLCVRPIDDVTVKGRRAHITVYELFGVYGAGKDLEPSEDQIALARSTRAAFDALMAGNRKEAMTRYQKVLQTQPDDPVARVHLARLTQDAPLQIAEVSDERR